ncbi:MAG: polynucleotide adenylyltransferase PcnB [Kiritimatiellae bacterium]|nr:polynucleotide adenylyltransferase PcnB [Kiritimatiellia bacterium]
MFEFLAKLTRRCKKGNKKPIIRLRADHCISRKNIDKTALKVLYRLANLGYTAYLVGGGVRDLLLGRTPKDFDVATDARPNEVKRAFRNCFLVGRRFRLAHICFGPGKIVETATFRKDSQSVGEIIEHASEGPFEDNTFGTPETDAYRRDFTVNGLFYDITTFSVIDWVGGLEDLEKRVIRSIGDPMIRFREDPVRMMRAIKFSSRLGFTIEKKTLSAIKELHSNILTASVPRLCEEIFRLFSYGVSMPAFKMMYNYGLMKDLMPELADFIAKDGGENSIVWKHLQALDEYEKEMLKKHADGVSNSIRAAVLYSAMAKEIGSRNALSTFSKSMKIPKQVYFSSILLIDSAKRLSIAPARGKKRFVYNRDFKSALIYNRIMAKAEKRDLSVLKEWEELYLSSTKERTR